MIEFEGVWKEYRVHAFRKLVLRDLNFQIKPGESLGICGANGAGKSTLMRLMSGIEQPTVGRVARSMSVSWPLGYSSAFQTSLTGADNARFIARIYNKDEEELLDFVERFAELGPFLKQPIRTYSAGMGARLAFAVSLAVDFDCYLIDEVTGAGDARFQARAEEALQHRRANATLVMVSHATGTLEAYCKRGAILRDGQLTFYDTIQEAIAVHNETQLAEINGHG